MYATEKTYVIAYLAISFGFVQGHIGLRTIRTSINYKNHQRSQLGGVIPVRGGHTSRVGTGSSKLLRNWTDMFIAEKNNWEAATSNSPVLSSKNDDSAECHGPYACLSFNRGDVSSGIGGHPPESPLAGKLELDDNDPYNIAEA